MRDDDAGREARGCYRRPDGSLATWRGYYDACGDLVVCDEERGGWDDEDDDE